MISDARALASRRNGAKSRGPRTVAGKARSARNALKHGLRARNRGLLKDEDATEFRRFERALEAELAPEGRLQADLVGRIAIAAWRARRADRLEAGVLGGHLESAGRAGHDPRAFLAPSADLSGRRGAERLATGVTRDNYGPRVLATRVRYRGSVLAERFRSLAALKLLQTGARDRSKPALDLLPAPARRAERTRESPARQELGSSEALA